MTRWKVAFVLLAIIMGAGLLLLAPNYQRNKLVRDIVSQQELIENIRLFPGGALTSKQGELLCLLSKEDKNRRYFLQKIKELKDGTQGDQRAAAVMSVRLAGYLRDETANELMDLYLKSDGSLDCFNLLRAVEISYVSHRESKKTSVGKDHAHYYNQFNNGLKSWASESDAITSAITEARDLYSVENGEE